MSTVGCWDEVLRLYVSRGLCKFIQYVERKSDDARRLGQINPEYGDEVNVKTQTERCDNSIRKGAVPVDYEVEEVKVHEQLEGLFLHGRSRVTSLRTRRLLFFWRIDVHQASST